jgi:hypothetical protein
MHARCNTEIYAYGSRPEQRGRNRNRHRVSARRHDHTCHHQVQLSSFGQSQSPVSDPGQIDLHKLLKCLKTRQYHLPIVQWLHAFAPAVIWPRDIRNVCVDSGCLLRVNTTCDACYECCCNPDFVDGRSGALHGDSSYDLRIKEGETEYLASHIIFSKRQRWPLR